jgi:hypothetical protein
LVAHYERLRSEALSLPVGQTPAPGLALFQRKGMTAWMRAWFSCTCDMDAEAVPPPATPACSLDIRGQLAALLAGMILGRPLPLEVIP